jgi:hypothetical protein
VTYYLDQRGGPDEFCGVPLPAVGVRVRFDFDKLRAARARRGSVTAPDAETADDGLVVHVDPMAILHVPDRLWRVGDLQGAIRPSGVASDARWIRAKALTVQEELPNWLVMGARGALVAQVIEQARGLSGEQATAIASMDGADEQRLVQALWDRWPRDHQSGFGSPIGCGLSEVHSALEEAARRTGLHLFLCDVQDGVEYLADDAWVEAGHAANAAALGLGAPEFLDDDENQRLALRWTTIMGCPGPLDEGGR